VEVRVHADIVQGGGGQAYSLLSMKQGSPEGEARAVERRWIRMARLFAGGAAILAGTAAGATTPGQDWLPVQKLHLPDHSWISSEEIWADSGGIPIIIAQGVGGIGQRVLEVKWTDSLWTEVWTAAYGAAFVRRGPSPGGRIPLFWQGIEFREGLPLGTYASLTAAEYGDTGLTSPDTTSWVWAGDFTYSGAASRSRRWAAKGDYGDLRLWYSDTVAIWREVDVPGRGDQGDALASVDDTTALVVWMDFLRTGGWGLVRGSSWEGLRQLPPHDGAAGAPLLRHRAGGGYWLAWCTDDDYVAISHLADADSEWSAPESLRCAFRTPGMYFSKSIHLSFDDHMFPIVSWYSYNGNNGAEEICICTPNDSGFTVADNLQTGGRGFGPVATRDLNDDVWVAWWQEWDGMFWTHTYTKATSSAPGVAKAGGQRLLSWTLSEAAPGSFWTVLRAEGDGAFAPLARVKATSSVEQTWVDTSPPPGALRYRLRRECLDRAYEWLSPEGRWPTEVTGLRLLRVSAHPAVQSIVFDVLDAAPGAIEIRLLDLQGRERLKFSRTTSGLGVERVEIPLAGEFDLRSGVYFLRVRDSTGAVSPAMKTVVLR
jgi:hypothetical protein